jgi:hypothetical protein
MLRRGILKARVSPPSRYGGPAALSRFLKWQLAASRIPTFLGGGDGRTRINGE